VEDIFHYVFDPGNKVSVNTPFDLVDKQTDQKSDCIVNVSTYSNGLKLEMTHYVDRIVAVSNMELVEGSDGSFNLRIE
jgi:hypothetical protein